jgi:predicted Co/Zn/Cd cation transporter (cation efflux family)
MTAQSANEELRTERWSLSLSVSCGIVLAALGIVIGVVTGSQIILFDGFYTFLGIGLSSMALRVSHLVARGPTLRYPFGREALTPLIIAIEGVALLATCIYASFNAVLTIVDGGSKVPAGWALAYAALACVICAGVYVALRRSASKSELVRAENTAWLAGSILGLGMLLAFIFARIILSTSWSPAARYVDPSLVIATCLAFIVPPLHMIRSTFVELVEGSPTGELRDEARTAVDEVCEMFNLREQNLRMTKIGRKFYVELDFVVAADWTVRQSDVVRHELKRRLSEIPQDLWLVVEFTADPQGT